MNIWLVVLVVSLVLNLCLYLWSRWLDQEIEKTNMMCKALEALDDDI